MNGFIKLTLLVDCGSGYQPAYKRGGPLRVNVKGIESYYDHRVNTLSGSEFRVLENFEEITKLIVEATEKE